MGGAIGDWVISWGRYLKSSCNRAAGNMLRKGCTFLTGLSLNWKINSTSYKCIFEIRSWLNSKKKISKDNGRETIDTTRNGTLVKSGKVWSLVNAEVAEVSQDIIWEWSLPWVQLRFQFVPYARFPCMYDIIFMKELKLSPNVRCDFFFENRMALVAANHRRKPKSWLDAIKLVSRVLGDTWSKWVRTRTSERFSNECRKSKTKVIMPANHNKLTWLKLESDFKTLPSFPSASLCYLLWGRICC